MASYSIVGTLPRVSNSNPTLEDLQGEAHVYITWVGDAVGGDQLADYHEMLSDAERERQARFHFERHRHLFLVSHALVRTSLSRYSDVAARDWRFSEGEFGRPEIASDQNPSRLRFNLSHTEGLAACIVCVEADCGVDVERMHRVKDLDAVARRVFTQPELDDLQGRKGDELEGRFTQYWTLKEAYMKARGKGFQLPPNTFTMRISSDVGTAATLVVPDDFDDSGDQWQLGLHPLVVDDEQGSDQDVKQGDQSDAQEADVPSNYRLATALRIGDATSRKVVVRQVIPR